MATTCLLIVLSMAAQLGGGDRRYVNEDGDAVIDPCYVVVQEEVLIPAKEAGVLIKMSVKEGSRMSKDDVLATIDDHEAKMGQEVAEYGFEAARQRAMDKIEEKYAKKAAEVAKVDWEQVLKANLEFADAVPEIEVRQKKLVWERSNLQIEKAQKDRELAKLDAKTKWAELKAAKMAVEMRLIHAPFDGEVVKMYKHEAEWVNPGDPILKLVRFDALYVEGYALAKDFDREELLGRSVTVSIAKAHGRKVSVPGTITHVSSIVRGIGDYLVRAEVQNQRDGDSWLIQPGLKARMTIHLSPESRAQSPEPERR